MVTPMPFADVNGQRLYYEDTGIKAPVVVFSHGFLMDHEMFASQVEALASQYRCIAWDQRNHGRTVSDGLEFDMWDSAEDCLGMMDHLAVQSAVLVGMSQGGYLSLRAALRSPDRVRALALIDTQVDVLSPEMEAGYREFWTEWASPAPTEEMMANFAAQIIGPPELADPWVAKWKTWSPSSVRDASFAALKPDPIADRLGEIDVPVIVFHGTADKVFEVEKGERISLGVRNSAGFVKLEGGTHAANLTNADEVNEHLLAFLTTVSAGT